ncbi:MAG: DUF3300 domain-containing protein [Pyrinomonadaceae bacterium]|nr:DUF3300 domain-containing protein [Pyrinomonadaceae bacterium]
MLKRSITTMLAITMAIYPFLSIRGSTHSDRSVSELLSAEQIDNLMAPIALYPDPLLAQMLPASTFVDQIDKAARYLRSHNNQSVGVDDQDWAISVKSIAHYPDVVYKMNEKLDWTTAVGQAYVTQPADVFNSIQRLRKKAKEFGYLKTTPQQTVVVEKEAIKIVPAQPQYIYVPQYNPQVVYVEAPSSGPSTGEVIAATAIAFTSGLLIGAWLNNDCDWYGHTVYYHGWHGVGWVSHSATVVRWHNSYYVNPRYTAVHYNTAVVNRSVNFNNINVYTNVSRNINYNNVSRNRVNVNNVNVNNVGTANVTRNNVSNANLNRNINSNVVSNNAYRGKPTSSTMAAPQATAKQRPSGFSGSGSSAQVRSQSQRGSTSRASVAPAAVSRPTRAAGGRRRN